MDQQVASNTISFLMRTDIKGHEAFAMVECVNQIKAAVEQANKKLAEIIEAKTKKQEK